MDGDFIAAFGFAAGMNINTEKFTLFPFKDCDQHAPLWLGQII